MNRALGRNSIFLFVGISVLLSLSGCSTLITTANKIASATGSMTSEQEYYLGRSVSAVVLSKYPLNRDAGTAHYLQSVAVVVAAVSDQPETFGGYHVGVLDTDEINALSAPGGYIFISRGFIKLMPNEEALAAVLAHEVGRIVKGHGASAIQTANLTSVGTSLGLALGSQYASSIGNSAVQQATSAALATFGDSITKVADTLVTKGYSRSQEYEADEYAILLLQRAGYSPSGMTTMLELLGSGKKGGGWFDTHPAPEDRLSEVRGVIEQKKGAEANIALRTERFRRMVKRS